MRAKAIRGALAFVILAGARALTNHSYADSVARAAKQKQPPAGAGSLERFTRASRQAAAPPAGDLVTGAFALLDDVRWSQSQWNIVYDPVHLRVSFRTRVNRAIKTLELGKLDEDVFDKAKVHIQLPKEEEEE